MLPEWKSTLMGNHIGLWTENIPEGVPLVATGLDHPYNRLDYYYPRIPNDVPTPKTKFFDIEVRSIDDISVDISSIRKFMQLNGYNNAFVRSVLSSAKRRPISGSFIERPSPSCIESTIYSLIQQHEEVGRSHGDRIAVREYVDMDCCPLQHSHVGEVRYFIDKGEVLYRYPPKEKIVESLDGCGYVYSYIREALNDIELPDELCERVAKEFDELSWSVDFIRSAKTGDWYLTDMGLNGVYWNENKREWLDISEHPQQGEAPSNYI